MTLEMILLCIVAFAAGFVDAIVGGGGLIQTPAGLVLLPQYSVATVIGTLKVPAFCGTSIAAVQYSRQVDMNKKLLPLMMLLAGAASFAGSYLLTRMSNSFMKPLLLGVLVAVAIYTYSNKQFGIHAVKTHSVRRQWVYALLISLLLGLYDGFIGPGAGSFLILAFISLLGFDFLKASAYAKFVNASTNLGSIVLFAITGKIIYAIALPMAVCNALGGWLGSRLALLKGNTFIRIFFLVVVCLTIIRFAYDVFFR
ncbi:MAG TPA: TSUP family transporter [Chitinophagaceae bacterium]|nr:TSUP family transporter [Chitinophagaceae bacterium]